MARIEVSKYREQNAHFGLYRTSTGGDQGIIVRRKVGDPTDYMHTKSRKLANQRHFMTVSSQHYAQLTPSQKLISRRQIEEVEYQPAHGKTDTKLLTGRQLFISKEMHSLKTTGTKTILPHEVCIILVDKYLTPLQGELWLRYKKGAEWIDCTKQELATGCFLFSKVPRGEEFYRLYGESENLFDPIDPSTQFMDEEAIRTTHYHILRPQTVHLYFDIGSQLTHCREAFTCPISTPYIDAFIEANTKEYEGFMKAGFQTMDTPPHDNTFITSKQRQLFPMGEFPHSFQLNYTETILTYGERYYWAFYFIPDSPIFGIFHTHLRFNPPLL